MGAAAGAAVRPGHRHDAHRALQLLFAPVGQVRQLFLGVPHRLHRHVLPDHPVGPGLGLGQPFVRDGNAGVHGQVVLPDVKAHVLGPEHGVQRAGENVLAGVLLAHLQPAVKVHVTSDRLALCQRGGKTMHHLAALFVHVQHVRAAQGAPVGGLAAPLRVKGGAVQRHGPGFALLGAAEHPGGELAHRRLNIIKRFGLRHKKAPLYKKARGLRAGYPLSASIIAQKSHTLRAPMPFCRALCYNKNNSIKRLRRAVRGKPRGHTAKKERLLCGNAAF